MDPKDKKYADSLAQMARLEYQMDQRKNSSIVPHIISRKKLIYIGVSIVVTIASLFISPLNPFSSSDSADQAQSISSDTTQKLIDATQELQDANNASNVRN